MAQATKVIDMIISIHASRGGSDGNQPTHHDVPVLISIHASRGGSDERRGVEPLLLLHFNPRFPWGKRRRFDFFSHVQVVISIHASRGGSDSVLP